DLDILISTLTKKLNNELNDALNIRIDDESVELINLIELLEILETIVSGDLLNSLKINMSFGGVSGLDIKLCYSCYKNRKSPNKYGNK
ncbi:2610_t:CDS:2, partial [Entrophospora sp. SA101]